MIVYVKTCEDCPLQGRSGRVRCLVTDTACCYTKYPRNPDCPLTEDSQLFRLNIVLEPESEGIK